MVVSVRSAIVSQFCVRPTFKSWFQKTCQVIHSITFTNPHRLHIHHLAFTYSSGEALKRTSVKQQTWTGSTFSTKRALDV